jgi:phenylalanyl-tRNA synthetase beta chain
MKSLKNRLGKILQGLGYLEVMNFSFIGVKEIAKLELDEGDLRLDPMAIRNPLGEDTAVMRPTLVSSMLKTLSYNMNHATEAANLYEMAAVFNHHNPTEEGLPTETQTLCLGSYGEDADFFTVRTAAEALLRACGIQCEVEAGGEKYHHPGRCAKLIRGRDVFAVIGEVHPAVMENFDMPRRAVIAEINLQQLLEMGKPMGEMKPLPRFPAMTRDLALVMEDSVNVGPLMSAMKKAAGNLLETIEMFDVYRGAQVGEGKKSVAFSLTFRASDRTLTDEEITKAMDKVQKTCAEKFEAVIRG